MDDPDHHDIRAFRCIAFLHRRFSSSSIFVHAFLNPIASVLVLLFPLDKTNEVFHIADETTLVARCTSLFRFHGSSGSLFSGTVELVQRPHSYSTDTLDNRDYTFYICPDCA